MEGKMPKRIAISKRDIKVTGLEAKAKSLHGYIWCRIHDILEDLGGSDREAVILACLNVLEEFANKEKK